jgi:hypothetical protein
MRCQEAPTESRWAEDGARTAVLSARGSVADAPYRREVVMADRHQLVPQFASVSSDGLVRPGAGAPQLVL